MTSFDDFKKGIKEFGDTIAVIVNSFLLTLVYILGIGATSLIAKIFGKKFLENKISTDTDSYWEDLNITTKSMEDYYKQF